MALPIFQRTVVDDAGNVLAGATITIKNESTGLNATIYSDRNGSVPLTNPFTTGSDGLARFYAAPGEYRVQSVSGGTSVDWRYQVLTGTAAQSDVTTSPTDPTAGRLLKVGAGGVLKYYQTSQTDMASGDYVLSGVNVVSAPSTSLTNAPPDASEAVSRYNVTFLGDKTRTGTQIAINRVSGALWRKAWSNNVVSSDWVELLHTGNTGILTDAITTSNFDTVSGNNLYKVVSASSGVPYTGNWTAIHNQYDSNSAVQLVTNAGASTVEAYLRVKSAGNWQAYKEILHTGNTGSIVTEDYEEGTWTPVIVGTTTAGVGTYGNQFGRYTKVGNTVTISMYLQWSGHTGIGLMNIEGLPFPVKNTTGERFAPLIFAENITTVSSGETVSGVAVPNSTVLLTRRLNFTSAGNAIVVSTTGVMIINGTYLTN